MSTIAVKIPLIQPGLLSLFNMTRDWPDASLTDSIGKIVLGDVLNEDGTPNATYLVAFHSDSNENSRSPSITVFEGRVSADAVVANVIISRETGLINVYTKHDLNGLSLELGVERVNYNRSPARLEDRSNILQVAFNDCVGDATLTREQLVAKVEERVKQIIDERLGDPNFKTKVSIKDMQADGGYQWSVLVAIDPLELTLDRQTEG